MKNYINGKNILKFAPCTFHFALKTFFLTLLYLFIYLQANAQDNDSIYTPPFDTNKIKEAPYLSDNSDTTSYPFFIWNDKRNLGEVMNEKAGYFINYFNLGGRNLINYNGFYDEQVGIFRDGIQINDNYFGGFDIENISINEIETIEEISNVSSFLYGINTNGKAINVITKDIFQPEPFSQLRFSQDRDGSLNADVLFSIPFSKKLNVQIGANNHVIDGRYTNTDFNVWRARSKINFFLSPKFNARLNFDYTKIKRGLFEGVIYSNDLDSIIDNDIAKVVNSDSYERLTNYYYDLSLVGRLFKNRNSLTKLKLYSNNSLREYRDEENRSNPNGVYIKTDYHSIVYGMDFKQNILYEINNDLSADFTTGLNAYFNLFDVPYKHKIYFDYYTAFQKIDLKYINSFISGFCKHTIIKNYYYFSYGAESKINLYRKEYLSLNIFSGINITKRPASYIYVPVSSIENKYFELGTDITLYGVKLKFLYYYFDYNITKGYNMSLKYNTDHFRAYLNLDYHEQKYQWNIFPKYFMKSDISYQDLFFDDHLVLRIGFNIKYIKDFLTLGYDQMNYSFSHSTGTHYKDSFNADFYIGARIGHANVNFTVANIFNNFNYNTYLYPENDRGGFLESISRFTIVWDFLN